MHSREVMRRIRLLPGFLLFLWALPALAQTDSKNQWVQYSSSYWLNPQWALAGHFQYRSYKPADPRVFLAGTDVQYSFKDVPISVGAGYAHLFSRNYLTLEDADYTHENRLYQYIAVRGSLGKAKMAHRYQIEERWVPQGYHTRLRYLLGLNFPLPLGAGEEKPWYGIFRNEIRVIVREQPFDSNRIFGGVGYTLNKHLTLEGMWMSQLAGGGNH
ncbi:MAG: DUF2490 domain-containing protein, partial [Rufibacter sp.]